jgi:hypothetical protein
MLDAVPLTDQYRTRLKSTHRHHRKWLASTRRIGYALKQAAGSWSKSTQRPLLQTVGDRSYQQVAAESYRCLGRIETAPACFQLFDIERLEPRDFTSELLPLSL